MHPEARAYKWTSTCPPHVQDLCYIPGSMMREVLNFDMLLTRAISTP